MTPLEYEDISILLNDAPIYLWHKRYRNLPLHKSFSEIERDCIKRAILSMRAFSDKYAVGKKTYSHKQFLAEKEGRAKVDNKTLIKQETYDLAMSIGEEYSKNGILSRFLDGAEKLKKVNFQIDDIPCVSEIDIYNHPKNVIAFLEPTKDAGKAFNDKIFTQGHYIEMAFAVEAVRQAYGVEPVCYFIAIQKEWFPYASGIHKIPNNAIELGITEIKKAIELFKFSENTQNGYRHYFGGNARPVEVPQWILNKE